MKNKYFCTEMNKKKTIVFILNPHSGTHSKVQMPALIDSTIDKEKFCHKVVFTEFAGHAADIASKCVEEHVDIVVAVGGDGTMN